ncbi:MAG TPA: hypothetical protein VK779_02180 [Rhizomicrobium sp.]|jgi:hypothetical protein|nr:hypothetical protein [Rhizomicrobium sp.]
MQISMKALNARWGWTTLCALAVWGALAYLDLRLKAHTGYGTLDLQHAKTAAEVKAVINAWIARPDAALAGFNLGLDFLFMPLYGFALFFGAIAAREAFAPKPGQLRRIATFLAAAPLAGSVFDVMENSFELSMLLVTPTDQIASISFSMTCAKWICVVIGIAMALLGLAGKFRRVSSETKD